MSASPSSRPAGPPARAVEPSPEPHLSAKPAQTPASPANTPAPASAAPPPAVDDRKKESPATTQAVTNKGADEGKKAAESQSSKPADKPDAPKDTRPTSSAVKNSPPPAATPRVDVAAASPPPSGPAEQPAPPPPPPAAADPAATPATGSAAAQQACMKPADCQSKICLAGFCATSSGFALATAPALSGTTTATLRNGRTVTLRASSGALVDSQGRTYRAASGSGTNRGPQTACSDPRCILPADLVGLQEVDDLSGAPPGGRDLLSDAAIAGIVLALLFVVLFLLLVVPKVRDVLGERIAQWRNRKDERKQRELRDASTPDFGNEDASAFEKGFTPSASPAGELRGNGFTSAALQGAHGSKTIDIGDPEKAGIAYQQHIQPQPTVIYHSTNQHYQREEVASFTGAGVRRKAISFAADLPSARPAGVEVKAGGPRKVSPTGQQPRETVLPYTVAGDDEEQRSALMDLRMIASPALPANHALANPFKTPTMPSAAAFPAPPGQASFFSTPESILRSPATPGSAYSTHSAALPVALQAGGGGMGMPFGRLPINSHARRPTNIPQRPGLQRLPSVKVTPSSMHMASEMEWIASGRKGSPATSPQR